MKQLVTFVAPRSSDEVPVGQALQVEASAAATVLDHVFAGHFRQPPAAAAKLPAGHWKGATPPPGQYQPGGQGLVSSDVPGGQ